MPGWRMGFVVGNAQMVEALAKLKSYLDYGTFQPIQIASIIALNEGDGYVDQVNEIYRSRRDALVDGLVRAGWPVERPRGRCSCGRRYPSHTGRWDRSSSPSSCSTRPRWR